MKKAFVVYLKENHLYDCLKSIRQFYSKDEVFILGSAEEKLVKDFNANCLPSTSSFDKLKSIKKVKFDKIITLNSNCILKDSIDDYFNFPTLTIKRNETYPVSSAVFVVKPNADHFENLQEIYKNGFDKKKGWNNYGQNESNHFSIEGLLFYYFGLLLNSIHLESFEKIEEIQ